MAFNVMRYLPGRSDGAAVQSPGRTGVVHRGQADGALCPV